MIIASTVGLDRGLVDGTTKTVNFNFPADLLQLFDKASGNNLVWYDETSAKENRPVCAKY